MHLQEYAFSELEVDSTRSNENRSDFVKYGVILLCGGLIFILLATANSLNRDFSSSSAQISVLSSITSLDEIPRHIVYGEASEADHHHLFRLFIAQYGRAYDQSRYSEKFSTFRRSLKNADTRNIQESARGGTARHGITKFSDYTDEEFKSLNKAVKPIKRDDLPGVYVLTKVSKFEGSDTVSDWSGTLTTSVKDQGYCGSCWAFSTAAQIETDAIRSNLLTTSDDLSIQQLISCDSYDMGCDGGWTELGMEYVMENGIELDADYPYTSYNNDVGDCKSTSSKYVVKVDQYYLIENEDSMINYVLGTGPVSACADSGDWGSYVDGIVKHCGDNVDHCVQVVGVNTDEGSWKVRNTWGEDWGEGGYIRLATGSNMCGIATDPIYADVSLYKGSTSSKSSSSSSSGSSVKKDDTPSHKPTQRPTAVAGKMIHSPTKKPSTYHAPSGMVNPVASTIPPHTH